MDHNKSFIKAALRRPLNRLLVSILDNSSRIRKSFEDAKVQVTMALKSIAIIASAVAKDAAATVFHARYVAKIVKQKLTETVHDQVLTSSLPPSPGSDLSADEASKSCKDRRSMKRSSCRKPSVIS